MLLDWGVGGIWPSLPLSSWPISKYFKATQAASSGPAVHPDDVDRAEEKKTKKEKKLSKKEKKEEKKEKVAKKKKKENDDEEEEEEVVIEEDRYDDDGDGDGDSDHKHDPNCKRPRHSGGKVFLFCFVLQPAFETKAD